MTAQYGELIAYRRAVEAGAYDETLNLCAGYRLARGMGRGPVPGDLRAWIRIFKEGVDQPYSIMDGHKGEFISANQLRTWNFDSWFRSVHTLYLIHSDGFRDAARRCLGTDNQRERDRFALAIVNADVAGTLTAELTMGAGVAPILSIIKRSTRWAWHPAGRLVAALRTRITRPMITVAGVTILPLVGVSAYEYVDSVRRTARAAEDFLSHLDDQQRDLKVTARRFLMVRAVKLLADGLDKDDLSEFETWAKAEVRATDRSLAHEDFERIRAGRDPQLNDDEYASVLKAVLPVLDQLNLAP